MSSSNLSNNLSNNLFLFSKFVGDSFKVQVKSLQELPDDQCGWKIKRNTGKCGSGRLSRTTISSRYFSLKASTIYIR